MGTGPWEIDSLDPTKGAELSANPHWWGGKVPIQHISVTFFGSETSEALAFRAGEIDIDPLRLRPAELRGASGAKLLAVPELRQRLFRHEHQPARVERRACPPGGRLRAEPGRHHRRLAADTPSPIYTLTPPQLLRSLASQPQVDALLRSLPRYQYNLAGPGRRWPSRPTRTGSAPPS